MITVVLRKILFSDFSRGYEIEKVKFEDEDMYYYTVAKQNDSVYCYEDDDVEGRMCLEVYKDGSYISIYRGRRISEAEYEMLKTALINHKEVKRRREILEKEWEGIEVINA